jgi:hypothetical protein
MDNFLFKQKNPIFFGYLNIPIQMAFNCLKKENCRSSLHEGILPILNKLPVVKSYCTIRHVYMNTLKKLSLVKRIDQDDSILFSEKDKSFTHPSNNHQDYNSGSKESQKMFWGLDEENGDSESLIDELQGELFLSLSISFTVFVLF